MRIVHYINQFFGGIGGEERADYRPEVREGVVGPGMALKGALGGAGEIVATVICGDSWFNENLEEAKETVLGLIRQYKPDLVVAGPAFNAGRYGMACGAVAEVVGKQLGIPVITGMYKENPGVEVYRKHAWIVETGDSAAAMRTAIPAIAAMVKTFAASEKPEPGSYLPRGIRQNYLAPERGARRAVRMLVEKLGGQPFTTEFPMPEFDRVAPMPPVKDLSKAKIALVTSGGIVPKGNPDRIESSSASKFGRYSLAGVTDLTVETHETAHGGYDPTYANKDADRVLPVDVMRDLEREGVIGSLHEYWYATVGNGTAVASAKAYAAKIAEDLHNHGVDAVILTSTWGTCTRCGATMVKEIERSGIPVVHICTVVPISLTVGANRIVPAVAIPHPLGNPNVPADEEKKIRRRLIMKALNALTTEVHGQTVFE